MSIAVYVLPFFYYQPMEYHIQDFQFLIWMLPAAYFLGSIPTAVWVGRLFHGIDVREHGSGNAGATNVMRVLGVKTGLPVLLFDMLKGLLSVLLIQAQQVVGKEQELFIILSVLLGMLAVVGHIFPLFAQFRGGKGVATIAGVCFALHPLATMSALGLFLLVVLIWKYVSAGSISAGISFPIWLIVVYEISLSVIMGILYSCCHSSCNNSSQEYYQIDTRRGEQSHIFIQKEAITAIITLFSCQIPLPAFAPGN